MCGRVCHQIVWRPLTLEVGHVLPMKSLNTAAGKSASSHYRRTLPMSSRLASGQKLSSVLPPPLRLRPPKD